MTLSKNLFHLKNILKFALPILLANLIQSGYSLVDAYWVGRLGPLAVAGVTNAFPITFLLLTFGIGFSIAGSSLMAQYFGAKDEKMLSHTSAQTILASISIAIIMSIITFIFSENLLKMINTPADVLPYALSFLRVALIGTVFSFAFTMFQSVMRSIGEMKTPIYIGIITVLLNFILDPFFINGGFGFPGMGVAGAAMATIITQGLAAIIGFYILFNGSHGIHLHLKDFIPDLSFIKRTFLLGLPGSVEMASRSFSSIIITSLINIFGGAAAAAYGVGGNVFMLTTMMPAMAFSVATSILIGHKLGAREKKEARDIAKMGAVFLFIFTAFIGLIVFIFAKELLNFFIPNDASVMESGVYYIRVIAISAPFISLQFSATGILRSSGNMISSMIIAMSSVWLLQLPFAYISSRIFNLGEKGIYLSMLFSGVISAIISVFALKFIKWEDSKLIHNKQFKKEEKVEEEIIIEASR